MISCKNEQVVIRDLRDLTLPSIFDAWWASLNVASKRPIDWNTSRHASLWRFYLHHGIEVTGSPGILFIICDQVLRHPLEHWTSSMGKPLVAKAHITNLNKLTKLNGTELTSSTVDETVLTIQKKQGSEGITIVCSYSQIIFDVQFIPYWPHWQTKWSKLAANDFEMSKVH